MGKESIGQPFNIVFEHFDVKVDQQTNFAIRKFQIGKKLCFVNGRQIVDSLDLNDRRIFDQ